MGYDAIFIPLLVFNLKTNIFFSFMNWFTAIFWTLDVLMSVITGYHTNGLVEMRPRKILWNYFRTWFPLDILIVVSDWIVLASTTSGSTEAVGIVKFSKSLRITRILRLLRLLRMIRVSRTLNLLRDSLATEESVILLSVVKVIVAIVLVNHYIGCGWYGVGVMEQDLIHRTNTWVKTFDAKWGVEADFGFSYTTCLHWSLTQFTPATMEVLPENMYERLYAICVLVFALVAFSSLLTSINAAMTQLRKISASNSQQEMAVVRYLTEKRLSVDLGHRIWSFLRKHSGTGGGTRKTLHEIDVQAFKMLPETLRVALHAEVYSPQLLLHPVFHQMSFSDEYCYIRVCHRCMGEKSVAAPQELFIFGQRSETVFFLQSGSATYHLGLTDSQAGEEVERGEEHAATILCEMALWMKWQHVGRLVAQTRLELYTLRVHDFLDLISVSHVWLQPFLGKYARLYLSHMTESDDPQAETDLWNDLSVQQKLVSDSRQKAHQLEFQRSYTRSPSRGNDKTRKLVRMASNVEFYNKVT